MENFSVFSYQKKGNHRFCNDYFKIVKNENSLLILMADGHGGTVTLPDGRVTTPYCRATLGARFAVYLGEKLLLDKHINAENFPKKFKDEFDRIVEKHLSIRPLSEAELEPIGNNPHIEAYGTTFLALLIQDGKTKGFQLGDGNIHIVDKDGKFVPFIENDKDCYLNYTSSLCHDKDYVLSHFRVSEMNEIPACLILHTDGYKPFSSIPWEAVNCISDDNFPNTLSNLLKNHKTNDDLSFAIAFDSDLLKQGDYKESLKNTLKRFEEVENAKKEMSFLIDEYNSLKSYVKLAEKTKRRLTSSDLSDYEDKILPHYKRFNEVVVLLNSLINFLGGTQMSFFYNSFDIYTNGIITEEVIPLGADGKRVFFNIPQPLTKKIFTVINNELNSFDNGSKMETPVKGINRFCQLYPHEGNLIVIDTKPVDLALNELLEFPFHLDSKQMVMLKLNVDVNVTFGISDPEILAIRYLEGRVSDPCNLLKSSLKSTFKRVATEFLSSTQERNYHSPLTFINQVKNMESDIADAIRTRIESEIPFIRLDDCQIDFRLINSDALLLAANDGYETRKEILKRFIEAVCESYKVSVFPSEMAQVLVAYVQTNPGGIDNDKLSSLCTNLIGLTKKATPDEMLQTAQQIGLLT